MYVVFIFIPAQGGHISVELLQGVPIGDKKN